MRTLAAFAVTAATEDKKGVVHFPPQPDCPDLATIMATLLCALQVLQVETALLCSCMSASTCVKLFSCLLVPTWC